MVKQYEYNIYYFLYYYYYRNHPPPQTHTQIIRRNPLYISTCASLTASQTTEAQLLVSAASPHVLHSQHHRQLKHSSSSLLHLHMCFTHSITNNWSTAPRLCCISTCASLTASQTTEAQLLVSVTSPHVLHSQHHRQLKHSSSSLLHLCCISITSPHVLHSQHHRQLKHSSSSPLHLHMCFTHSITNNWSTAPPLRYISTCASLTAPQTTEAQLLVSAASPHVLHSQHHRQLKHSSSSLLHLHMCFTHSTTDNWSTAPRLCCISTCASLTASQTTEAQLLVSAASPHVLHSQHHKQLKHSSSSLLHLHMCFTHSITDNWSTAPRLCCISTCASLTASQTTEAQLLVSGINFTTDIRSPAGEVLLI